MLEKQANYGALSESDLSNMESLSQTTSNKTTNRNIHFLILGGLGFLGLAGISAVYQLHEFVPQYLGFAKTQKVVSATADMEHCTDGKYSFDFVRDGYDILPYFSRNRSDIVRYSFLDKYEGLIEPHANTTIVYSGNDVACSILSYFSFVVIGDGRKQLYKGSIETNDAKKSNPFAVDCSPYEELTITIVAIGKDNAQIGATTMLSAVCMYVRREIRELTDDDLDRSIEAMYKIWSVNEEEGQELYGENFHDVSWFASMHDFNAAWQDADHIHEGLGFLPQHNKISNFYELAIQAVDPSVSLFYWDFTIDRADHLTIYESPMFSENTFGELRPPADSSTGWTYANDSVVDATIPNGRWKSQSVVAANPLYDKIANGFGYMRGPWSMNPSPKLTRFAHDSTYVPKCSIYYSWLATTDFSDFMVGFISDTILTFYRSYRILCMRQTTAEDAPHASTHGTVGGVYGCDAFGELLDAGLILDRDSMYDICSKWSFYLKEWYRGNYLLPKSSCVTDEKQSWAGTHCGFECNDELAEDMISSMQSLSMTKFVPVNITSEGWSSWRDFICTGNGFRIFTGDHLESASTSDPSFWPIHPTQERLLQLKYMTGGFYNFTWPTAAKGSYVCNHANCFTSPDADKDYYDSCCYGHFEYDQLMDFTTGNRSKGFGPTNYDILTGSDPRSEEYSMTYIYSNFDFSHCDEDFDDLINTLAAEML